MDDLVVWSGAEAVVLCHRHGQSLLPPKWWNNQLQWYWVYMSPYRPLGTNQSVRSVRSYMSILTDFHFLKWSGSCTIRLPKWRVTCTSKMMKGQAALQKIINQLISNSTNRSKCSLVAFDHICRSPLVLLSELERKSSYYAAEMDGRIYLQNDERTSCSSSNIEYKSHTLGTDQSVYW